MDTKVSFTIRRPAPASTPPTRADARPRTFTPHAADSSDEHENEEVVEPVTGFDETGVQRLHERPPRAGPLVIPALANRDWKRGRRAQMFVPDGAGVGMGVDGSQGGLGTRDKINAGPQLAGLTMTTREIEGGADVKAGDGEAGERGEGDEGEDERARRALVAGAAGGHAADEGMAIDAIPAGANSYGVVLDETDAYKQDVVTRPDSASLADYERVPVALFGAALLRGMGWKEGTAASRTRSGRVEPWLPAARPALLGIGAKERPAEDIPGAAKGKLGAKPERRYVPVVRLERDGPASLPGSPSRSGTVSRAASKSASPYPSDRDRDRDRRRVHRERDRDRAYDDYGYDGPGWERQRERERGRRHRDAGDRGERVGEAGRDERDARDGRSK